MVVGVGTRAAVKVLAAPCLRPACGGETIGAAVLAYVQHLIGMLGAMNARVPERAAVAENGSHLLPSTRCCGRSAKMWKPEAAEGRESVEACSGVLWPEIS